MTSGETSALRVEPWLGDHDCRPEHIAACHLNKGERSALKLLAASQGITNSALVAGGLSAKMQASLVRRGLASAHSRTLLSGDRVIELAWMRITDAGILLRDRK